MLYYFVLCFRTILVTVIDSNGFSTPVIGVTVRFVGKNDDAPVLTIGSKVFATDIETTHCNFFLKRLLYDTRKAVKLLLMSPAIH